jgi:tRNA U34 5-carboxymethylaminomethyl modifying GTPase MnmE/TrmE
MSANRAILLTAPGASAIAVIRIAGEGVQRFLKKHFSRIAEPLRCVHGDLLDESGEVLDDVVIVLHEDGQCADINCHGGPWVTHSVFALAQRQDFVPVSTEAFPPFSVNPFQKDATTLIEREVWSAARFARTEEGLRMLLAQPRAWQELIDRGDLPPASWRPLIEGILSDGTLNRLLDPARVVIIGPPNVGKSTLANQLFAQERSITANIPGTTRDWVGELANIDGVPVMLIDTPGLRDTSDPIESEAIEKSREVVQRASLVLRVTAPEPQPNGFLPPSSGTPGESRGGGPLPNSPPEYRGREPEERLLENSLILAGKIARPAIDVINKADLLPDFGKGSGRRACCISATTGYGIGSLRKAIRRHLKCADLDPDRPRCWTARQNEILRQAREHGPEVLRRIITG